MLDEHQRIIYLAAEAKNIGWEWKTIIAQLAFFTRRTIVKGVTEKYDNDVFKNSIQKVGGGRKKLIDHQPEMLKGIENIVSPHTIGNPMNPLIWTSKSIRKIASELLVLENTVRYKVVRQCHIELGYSLQANKKLKKGEIPLIEMLNLSTLTK